MYCIRSTYTCINVCDTHVLLKCEQETDRKWKTDKWGKLQINKMKMKMKRENTKKHIQQQPYMLYIV